MNSGYIALVILVMAFVTAGLRFLPFMIFGNEQRVPRFVKYLGDVLPYGIMGMLVVYCLRNTQFDSPSSYAPQLIASAAVIITYVWKKNTLLSIVGGTVLYMIMVQFIF